MNVGDMVLVSPKDLCEPFEGMIVEREDWGGVWVYWVDDGENTRGYFEEFELTPIEVGS